jgi:large subunit ribosomal protein L24
LVQTTLLTLGIAIILALVAALVGPAMIDWQDYKAQFEEQAKQTLGPDVRVGGTIDVRLLPSPSIVLGDVQIGPAESSRKVSARGLSMELSLSSLMRGDIRANQVTLDRPEVRIALDKSGALPMPGLALNFDADRLAIERLTITDGQITLVDAASGAATLAVEGLNVSGEVGSLIGPFRLDGAFSVHGERYTYRLAGSRRGDDGGMKIRLGLGSTARALDFDTDGTVWLGGGSPRFEGAATLTRLVAVSSDGSGRAAVFNEPFKVAGKVKASTASVQIDKMEMTYGQEPRIIRVSGVATLGLGQDPRLSGALAVRQIDFDRVLPSEQKRSPFETVKLLVDKLAELPKPPLPVHLAVNVDSLLAGGATVSSLHGAVDSAADGWSLDKLDLRAPGATQVTTTGKLTVTDRHKVEFQGPVKVESNDPAVFFAWIEGRSASGRPPLGPMNGSGTVTLGHERVAVEGLKAEIEHKALTGRVAYRFTTPGAAPRLEVDLSGVEFDFDRALTTGQGLFAATSFERPGEVDLTLDIGRASWMGVEARKAQAKLTYDRSGLKIERLSIADMAGASIDASGRLDTAADTWRGSVAVAAGAQRLDGVAVLAEKFLPQTHLEGWLPQVSDALRKYGPHVAPLKVTARLDLEPQPGAASGRTAAKLKLNGTMAGVDVNIDGTGAGEIADPAAATVLVGGKLDAADGRALASLIGLDVLANVEPRPARMTFAVDGVANKTLQVNGRFTGADLNASAEGPVTAAGGGTLDVTFRAASTKLPRRAGGTAAAADLHAHLAIRGSEVATTDLAGKLAGSAVKGALTVGAGRPLRVNGRIEINDQADAAELFAVLTGAPRTTGLGTTTGLGAAAPAQEWTAEPFGTPAPPPMEGRVEFKAASAQWTAGARDAARDARDIAGAIRFDSSVSGFFLTDVTGRVADGRFALDGEVRRSATGVFVKSHVKVTGADLLVLLSGAVRTPATGRLSLEADLQGAGLSPASLVGSLSGQGTVTVENLEISGLNPAATDAVLDALEKDRRLANDAGRAAMIAGMALDNGKVKIASMTTPIRIAEGRAQLSKVDGSAANADIAGLISLGLADWQVNARFTLTGPPRKNAPGAERPAMTVTARGPLAQAQRGVDVAALINWAQQRAIDVETRRLEEIEKERKRAEDQMEQRRRQSDTGPGSAGGPPAGAGGAGAGVAAPGVSPQGAAQGTAIFDRGVVRPGSVPAAPTGP